MDLIAFGWPRARRWSKSLLAVVLLAHARSPAASAQRPAEPRRSVAVVVGAAQYDLPQDALSALAGVRADYRLARWLVAEAALTGYRAPGPVTYLVPEVQAQLQWPGRRFRPYVGVGPGVLLVAERGVSEGGTLSGAVGARMRLAPTLELRAEARVRARSVFYGFFGSADWVLGLGYRF
jgi:hypothetical protein